MTVCFLDQKLNRNSCQEVRLIYALKKLILAIMGLIILKRVETLFLNFKSMFRLKKPENHHKQKKYTKKSCPSFHWKIFVSY